MSDRDLERILDDLHQLVAEWSKNTRNCFITSLLRSPAEAARVLSRVTALSESEQLHLKSLHEDHFAADNAAIPTVVYEPQALTHADPWTYYDEDGTRSPDTSKRRYFLIGGSTLCQYPTSTS